MNLKIGVGGLRGSESTKTSLDMDIVLPSRQVLDIELQGETSMSKVLPEGRSEADGDILIFQMEDEFDPLLMAMPIGITFSLI